jgi:hypothetical protein
LLVERLELVQQFSCLRIGGAGWRVEPAQILRIGATPFRQLERQRREIRLENLGRRLW